MKPQQASEHLVAIAAEAAGVSAPELASLLGITEPAAWDLFAHPDELTMCLSLRQLLRLSSLLRVPTLALLEEPQAQARKDRSFQQLADEVRACCIKQDISMEQFSDELGWDVRPFLIAPDFALDGWCLDALKDICHKLTVHWPDYFPK